MSCIDVVVKTFYNIYGRRKQIRTYLESDDLINNVDEGVIKLNYNRLISWGQCCLKPLKHDRNFARCIVTIESYSWESAQS